MSLCTSNPKICAALVPITIFALGHLLMLFQWYHGYTPQMMQYLDSISMHMTIQFDSDPPNQPLSAPSYESTGPQPVSLLYFPELRLSQKSPLSATSLAMSALYAVSLPRCNFTVTDHFTVRDHSETISMNLDQSDDDNHGNDSMTWHNVWHNESHFNLVYIKIDKVGGSTVSGVIRGIARKFGLRGYQYANWIRREPGTVYVFPVEM